MNYLARLGWSHGNDEIFGRDELVGWFDLDGLSSSPGRFDPEKLSWVNQEHLKRLPPDVLGARLVPFLERAGLDPNAGPPAADVAALLRDRVATLVEMADAAHYFYAAPHSKPEFLAQHVPEASRAALEALHGELAGVAWTREAIGALLKSTASTFGLKPPQVMMPLRALVAGTPQTPAIDAVLTLIGRDAVRSRIAAGLGL